VSDELKPGVQFDRLIAEKVFNYVWKDNGYNSDGDPLGYWADSVTGYAVIDAKWRHEYGRSQYFYSTHIDDAWLVAEFMANHGQSLLITKSEDFSQWECSWVTSGQRFTGYADTAPLAICLAALKAVGVS
jgi:hypothetical protein